MSDFENRNNREENDLGLKISPSSGDFHISAGDSSIREGDALLISYKAEQGEWTHVAERYKAGMSVSTGSVPEHVVIFTLREVEAALKLSEAPRSVYPEENFMHIGDPFSILSPSSPFHLFHLHDDPRAFIEKFDLSAIEQAVREEAIERANAAASGDLETLQSPVVKPASSQDDGDQSNEDRGPKRKHRRSPTSGGSADAVDPNYRTGSGYNPYRTDEDIVVPVVIINQSDDRRDDGDRSQGSHPTSHEGSEFRPDGSSVPFGEPGSDDKSSASFGSKEDDDKASAPFGEDDDKATAMFGGDKSDDFASAPFGGSEPSAYK